MGEMFLLSTSQYEGLHLDQEERQILNSLSHLLGDENNDSDPSSNDTSQMEDIFGSLKIEETMTMIEEISPIDSSSNMQKNRKPIDESQSSSSSLPILMKQINNFDVLLMRGSFARKNSGNKYYRAQVKDKKSSYDMGDKRMKTSLSWQVVKNVKEKGGRFLTYKDKSKGELVEVCDSIVRRKIAQVFRDMRRKKEYKRTVTENDAAFNCSCGSTISHVNIGFREELINIGTSTLSQL